MNPKKNDLSGFFAAIESEFPTITFKGKTFKVRRLTSEDNIRAVRYAKEDSIKVLEGMPEDLKNAPYDKDQLAKWVAFKSGDNVGISATFGMESIVTQGDLERCIFAISAWDGYIYALCLMHEDGTPIERESIGQLAKVIQGHPQFEKLIFEALKTFLAPKEDSSPNGEAQQVTQ